MGSCRVNTGSVNSDESDLVMADAACKQEEEESSFPVVGVSRCDSAALLWRVEDLRAVRSQGLVGALLGSLPRTPRQNGRLGRPLLLLPEEEELLMERRAAATLPSCEVAGPRQQAALYEEDQQKSYEEQRILALQDRQSALLKAMSSSHAGEKVTCHHDNHSARVIDPEFWSS